ncbi:MAG: DUF4366 domain-containing protein [Lachnospiraceae bacterium]|nr:DUF4366 domain-containing protein [Lachnospiraceae bacterium]
MTKSNKNGMNGKIFAVMVVLIGSLFCLHRVTTFAMAPESANETVSEEKVSDNKAFDEEWGPLTPSGNMTLVDDYGSMEAGGKQFITLVTKSGNYFYLIIDRDDEGNETVHFLNLVDESDILSLMDEDEVNEYIAAAGLTDKVAESDEEVIEEATEEATEEIETEATEETVIETDKTDSGNGKGKMVRIMIILLIAGLAAVGGYIYYVTTKNSKKKDNGIDPDVNYTDEDYIESISGVDNDENADD